MKQRLVFIAFALVLISVPLYVMLTSENVLGNGHFHKIKLAGFDPVDPFRGRYIQLNYDNWIDCDDDLRKGDPCFVSLERDSLGWSTFSYASKKRPEGSDYFNSTVLDKWNSGCDVDLDNLTKYFINEDKASIAEEYIINYVAQQPDDIYAGIRVLEGEVRLEDVYIEETPLLEFLKKKEGI